MDRKMWKRRASLVARPVIDYILRDNSRRVIHYSRYYDHLKIKCNTIFYESRDGQSMTDSPYAMFQYMLSHPDFANYQHIWSIQDFTLLQPVIDQYKHNRNVTFVKRNSNAYLKYLASCEYVINNSTFQSFYIPKKGQTYINTWHGTPLKSMGFDIPGNPAQSQNVLRNFLCADYILSPNAHTTKIFQNSYKLQGLYKGKIIEEGYPRIDLTLKKDKRTFTETLKRYGLTIDEQKQTILYAPTWKGQNVSKANNDLLQIFAEMEYLKSEVGDRYNILIKVHPFLYKEVLNNQELSKKLVPDFVDTNELLGIVDLLITDYSSIFFDFLVTGKPIIFYTWDSDAYSEERGQYIDNSEFPGPVVYNSFQLAKAVKNISEISQKYEANYQKMQAAFTKYDDGNVTERIVQFIFRKSAKKLNLITCDQPHKRKILIYPGGMRDNGITSSFINLMNNIDYTKYDVTCFSATPNSGEVIKNLNKVNKNVRLVFKPGVSVYNFNEMYRDKYVHYRGEKGRLGKILYPEKAYIREHRRLFGNVKFDDVIDFSGYSLYWAKFLLAAEAEKKICFMHNDLLSDSERVVDGKRPHRMNLRGLFSVYHRFDKLVSVSKGTMELNRKNLIQYADHDKFDYVLNTINPGKILQDENWEKEELVDKLENNLSSDRFVALGKLTNLRNYNIWETLSKINQVEDVFTADTYSPFSLEAHFENTEIEISRKAVIDSVTYFKFSVNNQLFGWIHADAVEILPDKIRFSQSVKKIAKITSTRGNSIWTLPYNTEGYAKVSQSSDYKNVIVEVDEVAETIRGTYCRFSINKQVIGWIDRRALTFFESCTLYPHLTGRERLKRMMKGRAILLIHSWKNRGFINSLENRTLLEENMDEPLFGKISCEENYPIWSKPFPNYKVKKISSTNSFPNAVVEVKSKATTCEGSYFKIVFRDEQVTGWIDSRAVKLLDGVNEWIKAYPVAKLAEIRLTGAADNAVILSHLDGVDKILDVSKAYANPSILNGELVRIDQEAVTNSGVFCHLLYKGEKLGWLKSEFLTVKEVLGFQVDGKYIPEPSRDDLNFVNMGRLSPEKGQDQLIRAFASFHQEYKNSRLYILGKGPLKNYLQDIIDELGVHDSVFLVGQLENPFTFMKKCNCFVLSSHYEGQPMVLLEAMTLGMPIIATDIIANRTVLENGKYGLLVENSINGLEQGFHNFVKNGYQAATFDYTQYNAQALETFTNNL